MRVAFAGKGGVGKTSIAAMLARVLAKQGRGVLAVDLDVNPGLALALGLVDGDGRLPREAVTQREGSQYGFALLPDLAPAKAVERYAARGPDGLRLLGLGTIDTAVHDLATTHMAVRQLAEQFTQPGWDTIVDMEAGTKDVYDGTYVGFVDLLGLVTDGSEVSALTCRRLARIAGAAGRPPTGVVVNRASPQGQRRAELLARELERPIVGRIPADDMVRRADIAGSAVVDYAWDCSAVAAIQELAWTLRAVVEGVRR